MENTPIITQENHFHNDNRVQVININQQPERVIYSTTEDYNRLLAQVESLQGLLAGEKEYASKLTGLLKVWVDKALRYEAENKELKKQVNRLQKSLKP